MTIFTHQNYNGKSAIFVKLCLKQLYKKDFDLYYNNGKPFVVNEEIFISISHTGKDIVIAISEKEVGIDIEQIKLRNYQKIADKFLKKKVSSLDEFYCEWTKYEAKFKHGGENGVFFTKDIFENVKMTIFSEDTYYNFISMDKLI